MLVQPLCQAPLQEATIDKTSTKKLTMIYSNKIQDTHEIARWFQFLTYPVVLIAIELEEYDVVVLLRHLLEFWCHNFARAAPADKEISSLCCGMTSDLDYNNIHASLNNLV